MGRKDYNKGMEAGARPFEDKFRQEQKRNQEWKQTFEEKFDNIKETNEAILDEMDSMQKKQFFKDNTVADISILEKGDRETLLALLFTLAETEENVNEYQQRFIRSVRKYLEKPGDERKPEKWAPLKDGDWSIIETIIGIDETKAIAQAIMEFLFLGYRSHEAYEEAYEDLFDCFCLNRKAFGEIRRHIDNIYRATGLEGIAENYGYVTKEEKAGGNDDEEKNELDKYGAKGKLAQIKITDEVEVGAGQEKVFENSKVVFGNGMKLGDGAVLHFRNCEISLDGHLFGKNIITSNRLPSQQNICILLGENCRVSFDSCTVGKTTYTDHGMFSKDVKYFISGGSGSKLSVENSRFDGSNHVFYGASVLMKDSYVNWIVEGYDERGGGRTGELVVADNIEVSNVTVCENEQYTDSYQPLFEARQYLHLDRCRFNNCFQLIFVAVDTTVNNSDFVKCVMDKPKEYLYASSKGEIQFKNCHFQECIFKGESRDKGDMRFEKSGFVSCVGQLHTAYMDEVFVEGGFLVVSTDIAVEMSKCRFSNGSFDASDDMRVYQENKQEEFSIGNGSRILDCIFENMNLGKMSLIGCSAKEAMASCSIENCTFTDINTKSGQIINRQYRYYKEGVFSSKLMSGRFEVHLQNCTGL